LGLPCPGLKSPDLSQKQERRQKRRRKQIPFGNDKHEEQATAKANTEILSEAQNDDPRGWGGRADAVN
jgi:hypothetical protein